jgi:translation initiation factor 2 alpha subunit (eIF-2alpha)
MNLNFYSIEDPKLNELVIVQFIEKGESFFKANLLEYPYKGLINFQNATKKKKINSWNKIITLNKNTVVKIIDIDKTAKIVQLSLLNLTNELIDNKIQNNMNLIQEKLLIYFNENKQFEQFIKSFCLSYNYDFNILWKQLVYHIDVLRREYNNKFNTNISLGKYFNNNISFLETWINTVKLHEICYANYSKLDLDKKEFMLFCQPEIKNSSDNKLNEHIKTLSSDESWNQLYLQLKEYYQKKNIFINKLLTKIGIISNSNINHTKDIFSSVLQHIKCNYELKYNTAPYYIFETSSLDSSKCDHDIFINQLQNEIKKYEPDIYIDISETVK